MIVTPGAATQLVVTTQPATSMGAGTSFGLVVSAEDSYGNVDTSFGGNVTIALAGDAGAGALGGTLTVDASQGIATFAGLTLTTADTGDSIKASAENLSPATTQTFDVTPGAAVGLTVINEPPGSVTVGNAFGLTVAAEDSYGNVDTSFDGALTVALADDPADGALSGFLTVTATQGVATITGLTLDTPGNGYTLQVSSAGLTTTTTTPLSVPPGPAASLVVTSQPTSSVAPGSRFGLVITAKDSHGNVATSFDGNITVVFDTIIIGGATPTLGGTLTVAAIDGVATFTDLTLDTAGTNYYLRVTSGSFLSGMTGPLTVKVGSPTQLVITSQPPKGVDIGDPFGIAIVAEDAYGNVATSFNGNVTVSIASGAGDGALAGTLNVAAVQGVASFTGLTLDIVGSGYALQATSSGLTAATTTHVTVSLGPVPHLVLLSPPSAVTVGQYFQVTVIVEDSTGAIEASYTGDVTLAMASDPGGATLGGNLTMPVTDGKVTFYGLTLNVTGSGYAIRATGSGFSPAVTAPITVVDPPATQLVVAAQPPSIVTVNQPFGLTVAVEDASGAQASGFRGNVTIALSGKHPKGSLHGTLTVAAIDGVATFTGLTLTRPGKGYTIKVTASGLASTTTTALNLSPAARHPAVVARSHPSRARRMKSRA